MFKQLEEPKVISGVQVTEAIYSTTLMGCGFKIVKGGPATLEQGLRTPFSLFLVHLYAALLHNQS